MMRKTTFTLTEVAQLLSCHKGTLRRAIQSGELRAARLGRDLRVSRADLQSFWTAQGGGELFAPDDQASVQEESVQPVKAKRRKASGPVQLSLPSE